MLSQPWARIGDAVQLSALVKLLAFRDEAHARTFLVFHGLVVEDGLHPQDDCRVFLPKKGSVEEVGHPLLGQPTLPEFCNFDGPDALLLAKFACHSRSDIVLGHADPTVPQLEKTQARFPRAKPTPT